MSASNEKRLRAIAKEEGTDKKTIKAAEEAKKQAKTRRKYIIAVIAAVVFVALTLFLNSGIMYRGTTALYVGNDKYSPAEANYEYAGEYYSFVNTYGSYATYFGLDTTLGVDGLGSQSCSMTEDGGTWLDYFKEQIIPTLQQLSGLCAYAEENGIELTEEEKAEVEDSFADIEETATSYGYRNADAYFEAVFGKGVNTNVIRQIEMRRQLAYKVYDLFIAEAAEADTDFVDYDMINVRHILVNAEADEDGNFTDEALAEAKAKAEEILAEYEAGDKTEESFADLAEEYSEDSGSNTNGGLYENVYKDEMVEEFNDWCFDSSRKAGDTGIVYGTNGSYAGYHVMYFSGTGDKYSTSSARESELASVISDKITEIEEAQQVKTTLFYNLVGKS